MGERLLVAGERKKDLTDQGGRGLEGGQDSHLYGGGEGDSGGAEATRSSDLGLVEVVVGGIGGGGGGGRGGGRWQGRGSF